MRDIITLKTSAGDTEIRIPSPADIDSFYLFAMHKSGSTLLNKMMNSALTAARIPQIAIPDVAFAAGLPENNILNADDIVFERGYCYRGFRIFPSYLRSFDLSKKKKILLVRDPRDMIVSYYFSMSQSHVIPDTGPVRDELMTMRDVTRSLSIDDFCIDNSGKFLNEFESYQSVLQGEHRLYRYEDVVFNKLDWLNDMLWYLGLALNPDDRRRIAEENDIRPAIERPNEHIRQVTPGNHRKHLNEITIESMNCGFKDILDQFGYAGPRRATGNSGASGFASGHYVLGDEMAFAANRIGTAFLRSGFSHPEPWGVWTVEPKATIAIPIKRSANLFLWLQFQTFARPAGPPAGLAVEVRGQQIGAFSVKSGRWGEVYECTFRIPKNLVSGPVLDIDFTVENGPTPAELRPGQRPIGIGLHRMRLSVAQ
jgi:hypothetical protein